MNDIIASVVIVNPLPKRECKLEKDYLDNIGVGVFFVVIILLIFAFKTGKI